MYRKPAQTGGKFVVSKSNLSIITDSNPSLDYLGLSFYPSALAVASNKYIYANFLLGHGWSAVEGDFVWSVGKESELFLRIAPHSVKKIHLDLGAFLPRKSSVQQLAVKLNDIVVANMTFTSQANRGNAPSTSQEMQASLFR